MKDVVNRFIRSAQPYYDTDGGGGSGAGMSRTEIEAMVAGFVAKQGGDANKAASILYSDNYDLRTKNRNLQEENDGLKRKVPAEGSVVLSKEDAEKWNLVKELGDPKDLKKTIEKAKELEDKLQKVERTNLVSEIAQLSGFKPSVLEKLSEGIEFELKTVNVKGSDGKLVEEKQVFVKNGDKLTGLSDYAQQTWSEFMPALKATDSTQAPAQTGVSYPPQGAGGSGGSGTGNMLEDFISGANKARESKSNPLATSTK